MDVSELTTGHVSTSITGDLSSTEISERNIEVLELQENYDRLVEYLSTKSLRCDS